MRKVRSKTLWQYLSEAGVLDKDEATILKAKREYRKQYKQQWGKQQLRQKELRPSFTLNEFASIQAAAKRAGQKPTTFARDVILAAATKTELLPNKPVLMKALQYISIAAIELSKGNTHKHLIAPIETAEKLLLQYLFPYDSQANPSSSRGL